MNKDNNKNDKKSNQITKDLHKMEREMKTMNFDYLQTNLLFVEVENESLDLQLNYLKGE